MFNHFNELNCIQATETQGLKCVCVLIHFPFVEKKIKK